MEDELGDRIIYQTYVSHMRIISKFAWGLPLNLSSSLTYPSNMWKIIKLYMLKPELLIFGSIILIVFMYTQALDMWTRNLIGRIQFTLKRTGKTQTEKLSFFTGDLSRSSWELKVGPYAAYAIQGRRPKMEDRFVINDNINNTNVALFAVFDGHGGEFAVNYAKEKLIQSINKRVVEIYDVIAGKTTPKCEEIEDNIEKTADKGVERRKSIKKTTSTTDECTGTEITDVELLSKLNNIARPITREVKPSSRPQSFRRTPSSHYCDQNGKVNYGKLLTDEVLEADHHLLESLKKNLDVAGTTALIAVLENAKLIVANVGDSRGVMCDGKGNVIPLSFDHKPQQRRERNRIKEAGGFVSFNGVWRVAGILATSRALGDYPLKDRRLVIADPDVLTFNLRDHRPMFLILASDGLWDTFSNEEAVGFIKERLHEPDYGAKSLTLQSYYRGSLDNITVVVINFKDFEF